MLEGLVAWVLNTYLGEYVENLNTDQLSIGIFQGNAELESLPLKKTALKSIGLPLEVKTGLIGKITLQIPIGRLDKEWIITIEDLFIVAGPDENMEYDSEAEEKLLADRKNFQLSELEENFNLQKQYLQQGGADSSNWSWWSYGTSFVTNIIDNFQIKILNVNLRYEDFTSKGQPFACGMFIQRISAQSCSADWIPGYRYRGFDSNIFKVIELQNFSIYWDCQTKHYMGNSSKSDFQDFFTDELNEVEGKQCFLLSPVSGVCKFTRNTSSLPLRKRDSPRICLDICLDEFPLSLNDLQFKQMHFALKSYDLACKAYRYKKFKRDSFCKNAQSRWRFALDCVLCTVKERLKNSTRKFILTRAKNNVLYVQMYTLKLTVGPRNMTKSNRDFIDAFEAETPIEELKILRSLVTNSILEKEKQLLSSKSPDLSPVNTPSNYYGYNVLKGWFPGWGGWYGSSTDVKQEITQSPMDPETSFPSKQNVTSGNKLPSSEFDDDLTSMIGRESADNSLMLMDVVFLKVAFTLKSGSLKLFATANSGDTEQRGQGLTEEVTFLHPLLELESRDIRTTFESRTRTEGWMIEVSMLDFSLLDKHTKNSIRPILVSPLHKSDRKIKVDGRDPLQLFQFCLEKNPFSTKSNYKLCISSEPLDIVYNPFFLEKVKSIFEVEDDKNYELDIAVVAKMRYEVLKRQTKHELQHTIEALLKGNSQFSLSSWIIKLDLFAPHITILEDLCKPDTTAVVFDLGRLCINNKGPVENQGDSEDDEFFVTPSSTPQNVETIPPTISESLIHEKLYDIYTVELMDLKVFVGCLEENWKAVYLDKLSPWHVVNKFSISLQLERRIVGSRCVDWPNVIINGHIPTIDFHVNEFKLTTLKRCLHSLSDDMNKLFGGRKSSNQTQAYYTDSILNSHDSIGNELKEENKLLSMNFSIHNLSIDVHGKGQCIGQLRISRVSSLLEMTSCRTNILFSVSSLIIADALQTFGPDYELLVASHSTFKNIILPDETQSSTRHSNDANFSEVQQSDTLIQLAIEIKGKSFLVNDEDPHYDVNFHFNSLDVIANQKTIVELIAFFQQIFPNDSLKEGSGSSYDFSLKTIKRIRIRSKFERLNVLLLSFEHEKAKKIALVIFADAQIDVEAGLFLELSGCLGGFQLENLTQGSKGERVLVQCGTVSESSPLHFQGLNNFSLTDSSLDLEPAFKFSMVFLMDSKTKLHQQCKLYEAFERSDSATKIRHLFLRCSNQPMLNLWKNFYHFYIENEPFTMMALQIASIKYVHSPEFVLELSRCLDNFKMYIMRLGFSLSSAATELAAGLVANEGNKKAVVQGDVDNASASKKKMKLSIDRKRVLMKDFIDKGLDTQDTNLNNESIGLSKASLNKSLMFAIVIESPVLMFPKEADSNEVLSVHLGTMSFSNVADQSSELSMDTSQTLTVEFSNICVFSLDLNKKLNAHHSGINIFGFPILHDTGFKVIINVSGQIPCDPLIHELSNLSQLDVSSSNKYVIVTGQLSPLKVVFTRAVLQQMLKTLDNISPSKEKTSEINSDVRLPSENNSDFESSLHLDEEIFQREQKQNLPKVMKASISMPLFEVLFKGGDGNDDIVKLTLQFLSLDLLNYSRFTINEIKLDSLLMEGLLGDQPRILMASYGFQKQNKKCSSKHNDDGEYLSRSCPSGNDDLFVPDLPPSLPSSFYSHFHALPQVDSDIGMNRRSQNCINFSDSCLVFLKIIKVSKESMHQKSVDYKVTLDFNRLETFVHLETWVLLLEVLGMSGKTQDPNLFSKIPQKDVRTDPIEDENIDITLKVHELSIVADKKAYELARFNISNFICNILKTQQELKLCGQLGSMSILDCSPAGTLYSERFQTTGKTALSFNVLKFSTPDFDNSREFDAHVRLEMSSVHYIHTHHFFQEMLAYIQNFNQFQEILNRSRAASEGCKVAEQASSNVRIKLDINAGAPVLFIPMSSKNVEVLVLDFGKLKIRNQFLYSGYKESNLQITEPAENTSTVESCHNVSDPLRIMHNDQQSALSTLFSSLGIHGSSSTFLGSHQQTNETFSPNLTKSTKIDKKHERRTKEENACLLDVIDVSLFDVEILSAKWFEGRGDPENDFVFSNFTLKRQNHKILKEKCHLHLCVERNLDGDFNKSVSDLSIKARLSSVQMSLNSHQYKLIRGLLAHNFGEQLAEFQYQLMSHLKDPKTHSVLSGESHVSLSIDIDLDNVQIELVHSETASSQTDNGTNVQPTEVPLALFDLVKSNLHFESMSDQSKDIGLVCQEINFIDTRYIDSPANLRPNVFSGILKSSESKDSKETLRLEVRCRMNKECEKYHVLLNNMRLMGIFDWLLATKNFLQSSPEDPFVKEKTRDPEFQGMSSTCQGSILTKRISVNDLESRRKFEFTLNMCNTELVVVEDSRERDTNAVIIKGTTVIVYKPDSERPLSCSLQNVEVYSCCMAAEDESALSIIDPMLLTLELNDAVVDKNSRGSIGLLEATPKERRVMPVLEVSFNVLSVRLSYNDIKLFAAIIDSMPKQVLQANRASQGMNFVSDPMLSKLQEFGFSREDCQEALLMCKGSLDDAVIWLNSHAIPLSSTNSFQLLLCNISGFELKEGSISVCLIDDCLDADVPLMELIVSDIYILYTIMPHVQGRAQFKLYGDYYNRSLSGWEPFIEKWGCNLEWQKDVINDDRNLYMDIKASSLSGIFNINITRTLIDLYSKTMAKWMSDFNDTHYNSRRRVPFIPYALRNQVGCDVHFTTVSSSPSRYLNESFDEDSRTSCIWRKVTSGTEMSFLVAERDKIRHKDSHDLTVHQIALKVDGWKDISPVSIDKVGTYFRHADPDIDRTSKIFQVKPCARLVFDVAIEGSARKIVTVRSALLINNMLKDHIEIKLESLLSAKVNIMRVKPYSKSPVPLNFVFSKMWVRPLKSMVDWCIAPINWQSVTCFGDSSNFFNVCCSMTNGEECYRFCVSIKRQDFPPDENFIRFGSSSPSSLHPSSRIAQPGHVITILAPLRIENLLPIEMTCALKHVGSSWQPRISVKPGKIVSILEVDLCKDLGFNIALESFSKCQEFVIPVGTSDNKVLLVVCDNQDRPLTLNVSIKAGLGGALKISVSAPYWLVNKSGLPLIFKQHESNLAAGQFAEHEIARSVTPLLFSFSDKSLFELCTMRVGNFLHPEGSTPTWCPRFMLERGVTVRQVRVAQQSRPDWVYNIGIEVHLGKGRYSDTSIVTFTPRYQLDNRTSYKLAFAQRHQTLKQDVSSKSLCALPNCVLPFHWPRVDLDTLLCVRVLDHTKCHWSGGFLIDKVDSFHINMRSFTNNCFFVHVDVILVGATFFVVFTDATSMPPPYRIDNFAEVPIIFNQSNVDGQRFHTCVKPKTSIPYAWDEPTLPGNITVRVPSGTSSSYDLKKLGDSDRLCYENFIYIAFSSTFKSRYQAWNATTSAQDSSNQELVLDVVSPGIVVLKRKEAGKRSQLWRMTSKGSLEHEGSSAPKEPGRKKASSFSSSSSFSSLASTSTVYVLDIKDIALQPTKEMALTLRKPDEKRVSTQTWKFIDGYLCCGDRKNLCLQVRDGQEGLRNGAEVILGPRKLSDGAVPPEMSIHREKLQPGSGFLCVKVLNDGPTRVLQITDVLHQSYEGQTVNEWVLVQEKRKKPTLKTNIQDVTQDKNGDMKFRKSLLQDLKLEVSIDLPGFGISLVDETPQELLYIFLKTVRIECSISQTDQILQVDVKDFQIDNQCHGSQRPVLLFASPSNKKVSDSDGKPVLHICAHKVSSHNWNAQIFKQFLISVKPINIQIEEKILWRLLLFLQIKQDADIDISECQFASARSSMVATLPEFKRYYFEMFKIFQCSISLSVLTADDLTPDLKIIKRSLRIPLIRFEDAQVELDTFMKCHLFETLNFLMESIRLHYTSEILGQAAKILGSVDFLGNPLGLFSDMAEGVQCLLQGNVGGLLKNVTKGATNSVAKVSGTLSDTVGKATMDKNHQVQRQQILQKCRNGGADHLKAGINSFWHGLYGAMVSIPTQAYHGAAESGITGFASGLAKGVVGTLTKPVAGVLDLTSGAANTLRDSSKGYYYKQPSRIREPRCCYGRCGLLPPYSAYHAEAQNFLFQQNHSIHAEMFVARYKLQMGNENESVQVLISNRKIYFMKNMNDVILQVSYESLIGCHWMAKEDKCYIKVIMKDDATNALLTGDAKKSPLVRCDCESVAEEVVQHIRYAKSLYNEMKQTLPIDQSGDDWTT